MVPPALVDLFCNDLEVATSVTMSEVGPTSAYLEHKSPLPVGAELRLHTDDGSTVGAVVVRVHEAVTDAARSPGMYVRVVDIADAAETWWKNHLDGASDPVFPEQALGGSAKAKGKGKKPETTTRTETVDMTADELARMAAEDRTEASAAVPVPGPPPEDDNAPNAKPGKSPKLAAEAEANSETVKSVNTTVKMTADQVKAITDLAPPEKRNGTSMGMAVAVPPPDVADATDSEPKAEGKKKKRRRAKKKKT